MSGMATIGPEKGRREQAGKQSAPKMARHSHTLFFLDNTFDKWHGL